MRGGSCERTPASTALGGLDDDPGVQNARPEPAAAGPWPMCRCGRQMGLTAPTRRRPEVHGIAPRPSVPSVAGRPARSTRTARASSTSWPHGSGGSRIEASAVGWCGRSLVSWSSSRAGASASPSRTTAPTRALYASWGSVPTACWSPTARGLSSVLDLGARRIAAMRPRGRPRSPSPPGDAEDPSVAPPAPAGGRRCTRPARWWWRT